MKTKTNKLLYIVLSVLIIFVITTMYKIWQSKKIETFSESSSTVEIVVSRYNENLEWLNQDPYNKYPVVIYNKGQNDEFVHNNNVKDIVNLPNVGREGHTYLYHIVNNYDNLSDMTIFLPGSCESSVYKKKELSSKLLYNMNEKNRNIYTCSRGDLYETEKNFQIDSYLSTSSANQQINRDVSMQKSKIRPFGEWYTYYFGNDSTECITYTAIFAISKDNILKKPKTYYMHFMNELAQHQNPEVGHYIERSWAKIFSQDDDTMYLYFKKE